MAPSSKLSSDEQPNDQCTWLTEPTETRVNAVVFVHGILGDQQGTWGGFPELLDSDPELPRLEILHWGYRSGKIPDNYLGVCRESEGLVSVLRTQLSEEEPISIIAHSMGGLITLNGITEQLSKGNAESHPVANLELVTLIASPLSGSAVANVVHAGLVRPLPLRLITRWWPSKQLRDLRNGDFTDKLQKSIVRWLNAVDIDEDTAGARIVVQVVSAKRDWLVSADSSVGPFTERPDPIVLEGGHLSVKRPDHHRDDRYLSVKRNLARRIGHHLRLLCRRALHDSHRSERHMAMVRIVDQYGALLERCCNAAHGGRYLTDTEKQTVLLIFLNIGAQRAAPPERVTRAVVDDLMVRRGALFQPIET